MAAALGEDPSGHPPESSAAQSPRYVFVVKAGKPLTFNALREVASPRPDLVGVTFDRRWMGDRRLQQGSGHVEQRRHQRRSRTVDSEWLRSGFVLSIADTSQGEVSPARAARHPAGRQVRRAASPVAAATSLAGAVSVSDAASVAHVPIPAATESREAISPIGPAAAAGTPPHAERMAEDIALAAESAASSRVGESAGTHELIDLGTISPVDAKTTPVQPVAAASESVQTAPAEPVPPSVECVAVPTVAPPPTSVHVGPASPAGNVAGPAAATPTPPSGRAASSGTTGRARSHVHKCRRCGHVSRHDETSAIATITDLIECPVCDVTPSRAMTPWRPAVPAERAVPSRPAVPAERVVSSRPAVPAERAVPSRPAVPAERAVPSRPAVPAERAVPSRPAVPAERERCPRAPRCPRSERCPRAPRCPRSEWSPLARGGFVVALARRGSVVARWRRGSRAWRSSRPCGGSVPTRGLRTA